MGLQRPNHAVLGGNNRLRTENNFLYPRECYSYRIAGEVSFAGISNYLLVDPELPQPMVVPVVVDPVVRVPLVDDAMPTILTLPEAIFTIGRQFEGDEGRHKDDIII